MPATTHVLHAGHAVQQTLDYALVVLVVGRFRSRWVKA